MNRLRASTRERPNEERRTRHIGRLPKAALFASMLAMGGGTVAEARADTNPNQRSGATSRVEADPCQTPNPDAILCMRALSSRAFYLTGGDTTKYTYPNPDNLAKAAQYLCEQDLLRYLRVRQTGRSRFMVRVGARDSQTIVGLANKNFSDGQPPVAGTSFEADCDLFNEQGVEVQMVELNSKGRQRRTLSKKTMVTQADLLTFKAPDSRPAAYADQVEIRTRRTVTPRDRRRGTIGVRFYNRSRSRDPAIGTTSHTSAGTYRLRGRRAKRSYKFTPNTKVLKRYERHKEVEPRE